MQVISSAKCVLLTACMIKEPQACSAKDLWVILSSHGENTREIRGLSEIMQHGRPS